LTFQALENAEPVVDTLLRRLSKQDLVVSADRGELNSAASAALDRWKQSSICRRLDDLLDENEDSGDEAGVSALQDDSADSRIDKAPGWIVVRRERDDGASTGLNLVMPNINLRMNTSISEPREVRDAHHPSEHQHPSYAGQLLQLFLSHGQSWLPILERRILLKTSFLSQRMSSSLQHGDRAALWGVYAYASATLGHLLDDDGALQHAERHCNTFYTQAYSMLPLDSDLPVELGHVQCTLLLSLTRFASGAIKASWRLVRLAVQMMREMEIQNIHSVDQDAFSKAWLGCFILDTLASTCLQCKPSLHFHDVVTWCHIDENGAEEWQHWQPPRSPELQSAHPEPLLDIPTHSLSMLMLQVMLLRILNSSLHDLSASGEISGTELADWEQGLSGRLSREGLTPVLQNADLDILQLPPSFTSLSIIYTSLWERIVRQSQGTRQTSSGSARGSIFPLLSQTNLKKIWQDRKACKRLPTLQLLILEGGMFSLDALLDPLAAASVRSPELPELVHPLPPLELPQIDPEANVSTAMAGLPTVSGTQEHAHQLYSSFNTNANPNQMAAVEQGSDSGIPSFDSYMDTTTAPFLEFLDTLDDRPM
jgi:hypothetical protein